MTFGYLVRIFNLSRPREVVYATMFSRTYSCAQVKYLVEHCENVNGFPLDGSWNTTELMWSELPVMKMTKTPSRMEGMVWGS